MQRRRRGRLNLDRRIVFSAICFAVLAPIEIHTLLEHAFDSGEGSHAMGDGLGIGPLIPTGNAGPQVGWFRPRRW